MEKIKERCYNFLIANKWERENTNYDFVSFHKDGVCSVDIDDKEIVLIDDSGDFLHIPLNYYALIGALIHNSQLSVGYMHGIKE